ncbi:CAMK family protein kinase [Tritrichomonas foetus]|uniref:CAMK family protein kinase n=1 Tax=Tritrichomonas foetus TaxID=1144522 RepID=A0A1J4JU68_9EUKA|nr:CAMK family protein kinase [Tritrichomonas foetus]|eukprot:OHT02258.1 CAMK family protein kinase [Tritrichomonas foetus]
MNISLTLPYRTRNYILESEIGRGGFGVVYRAKTTNYSNDYEFAVKVMQLLDTTVGNQQHDSKKAWKIGSFESEVTVLKKLDHPNVIRLYDFYREKDLVFIVLEYCPCGTLEERLFGISFKDKIKICNDIVLGLCYCHDSSIAHRDIKTQNILFDSNNRPKLADFGLAQLLLTKDQKTDKAEGSLYYASPEILSKTNHSPMKSDIWSFGVLVYRVFTGNYPFYGSSKAEIIRNIKANCYLINELPLDIKPLVVGMLKLAADERMTICNLVKAFDVLMHKYNLKTSGLHKQRPGNISLSHIPILLGNSTRRFNLIENGSKISSHGNLLSKPNASYIPFKRAKGGTSSNIGANTGKTMIRQASVNQFLFH